MTPNTLVNRTRTGIAPRSAQVYGPFRGAMPLRAGYLER